MLVEPLLADDLDGRLTLTVGLGGDAAHCVHPATLHRHQVGGPQLATQDVGVNLRQHSDTVTR